MFIDEQNEYWNWRAWRTDFRSDEQAVWIPVSRRHSCWTFQPNPYGKRLWG